MSVNMEIEVTGAEELREAFNRFDVGMQRRLHERLAAWTETVRAEASRLAPMRTGYLRSTIYARTREWEAEVGAEAAYAAEIEFGTRSKRSRPFLNPTVEAHLPDLERLLNDAIETSAMEAEL